MYKYKHKVMNSSFTRVKLCTVNHMHILQHVVYKGEVYISNGICPTVLVQLYPAPLTNLTPHRQICISKIWLYLPYKYEIKHAKM